MFAPRHPQPEHVEKIHQADAAWARNMSVEERFSIYQSLFDFIANSRVGGPEWGPAERLAWNEKLAARMRWVKAFPEYGTPERQRPTVPDAD
jgi:hypothetical protein